MARGLKLWIKKEAGLDYLSSEKKGFLGHRSYHLYSVIRNLETADTNQPVARIFNANIVNLLTF